QAATRGSRDSADGQLSRKAAGAGQRNCGSARAGRIESLQRATAASVAGNVPGKAGNAGRSFGGKKVMREPSLNLYKGAGCRIAAAGLLCAMFFAAAPRAIAAHTAQEEVSKDFRKTVTLGAGQSVRIDHKFGEVRVHGESGRDVKISATVRVQANSRDEAQ